MHGFAGVGNGSGDDSDGGTSGHGWGRCVGGGVTAERGRGGEGATGIGGSAAPGDTCVGGIVEYGCGDLCGSGNKERSWRSLSKLNGDSVNSDGDVSVLGGVGYGGGRDGNGSGSRGADGSGIRGWVATRGGGRAEGTAGAGRGAAPGDTGVG